MFSVLTEMAQQKQTKNRFAVLLKDFVYGGKNPALKFLKEAKLFVAVTNSSPFCCGAFS